MDYSFIPIHDPNKEPPYVPPELMGYLLAVFRPELPTNVESLRDVDRKLGQQDVIRLLAQRVKTQLNQQMET